MPDNAELQQWYKEGRDAGYIQKNPAIAKWIADGVKAGYLRDESGGSVYPEDKAVPKMDVSQARTVFDDTTPTAPTKPPSVLDRVRAFGQDLLDNIAQRQVSQSQAMRNARTPEGRRAGVADTGVGLTYPGLEFGTEAASRVLGPIARVPVNAARGGVAAGLARYEATQQAQNPSKSVYANLLDILPPLFSDPEADSLAALESIRTDSGAARVGKQVPTLAPGTLAGDVLNTLTELGSDPLNLAFAPSKFRLFTNLEAARLGAGPSLAERAAGAVEGVARVAKNAPEIASAARRKAQQAKVAESLEGSTLRRTAEGQELFVPNTPRVKKGAAKPKPEITLKPGKATVVEPGETVVTPGGVAPVELSPPVRQIAAPKTTQTVAKTVATDKVPGAVKLPGSATAVAGEGREAQAQLIRSTYPRLTEAQSLKNAHETEKFTRDNPDGILGTEARSVSTMDEREVRSNLQEARRRAADLEKRLSDPNATDYDYQHDSLFHHLEQRNIERLEDRLGEIVEGTPLRPSAPQSTEPEAVTGQVEQVTNPLDKPLYEMTLSELRDAKDLARSSDAYLLARVFGPQAKEYRRLEKLANSTSAPRKEVDAASAQMQAMEDALPKAKYDLLFNGDDDVPFSPEDYDQYIQRLDLARTAATEEELADTVAQALIGFPKNPDKLADEPAHSRLAYATVREATDYAREKGWNTAKISNLAAKKAAQVLNNDPQDVERILGRFLKTEISTPPEAPLRTVETKELPAPVVAEPAPTTPPADDAQYQRYKRLQDLELRRLGEGRSLTAVEQRELAKLEKKYSARYEAEQKGVTASAPARRRVTARQKTGGVTASKPRSMVVAEKKKAAPAPAPSSPRIKPKAIDTPSRSGVKVQTILSNLSKAVNANIRVTKQARGTAGSYNPTTAAVSIANQENLDEAIHEAKHALDDRFGITAALRANSGLGAAIDAELIPSFSQHGSEVPSQLAGTPAGLDYERSEGIAEFLRAYMVNPEEARAAAPNMAKLYEDKVDPKVRAALEQVSNDIRTVVKESGEGIIQAKIGREEKSLKQKAADVVKSINPPKDEPFQTSLLDSGFRALVTDEFAPAMTGYRELKERTGATPAPSEDFEYLVRQTPYIRGKVTDILENGMINGEGERVTGPIADMFSALDTSSVETLRAEANDAIQMMIAERQLERPNIRTGIAGGSVDELTDVEQAQKVIDRVKADPARYARLQEFAEKYRQVANSILDYLEDKKYITPADVARIKKANTQYVSLQRIVDDLPAEYGGTKATGLTQNNSVLKKLKGSERTIADPVASLIGQTYAAVKAADQNEALAAFVKPMLDLPGRQIGRGTPIPVADIVQEVPAGTKGAIAIRIDGTVRHFLFEEGIAKALREVGKVDSGAIRTILKVFELAARGFRTMITSSPAFQIRNKARDVQGRMVTSRTIGAGGIVQEAKNTFARQTPEEAEMMALFGANLTRGDYLEDIGNYKKIQRNIEQAIVDPSKLPLSAKLSRVFKKLNNGYKWLMSPVSEESTRTAEFRSAKAKARKENPTWSEYDLNIYAAAQARDLLDFARGGRITKVVNRYIPFTNAQIQGIRRTVQAARENPKRVLFTTLAFSALASGAFLYARSQGKEEENEYREFPPYLRMQFYLFKTAPDQWVAIPKPHEVGVFSSLGELGIDYALGNKKAFEGMGGQAAKSILPFDAATLTGGPAGSFYEALVLNKDIFKDAFIVPPGEEKLDMKYRTGQNRASRLGQTIGAATKTDARTVDFLTDSLFGDYGRVAKTLSDTGRKDTPPVGPKLAGTLTGLRQSPAINSASVQKFIKEGEKVGFSPFLADKRFQRLVDAYYGAAPGEAKEEAARKLYTYAQSQRVQHLIDKAARNKSRKVNRLESAREGMIRSSAPLDAQRRRERAIKAGR